MERKFRTGLRMVEVAHYEPGVRRSLEVAFDGVDTADVMLTVEHHGGIPGTSQQGIALNEEEVGRLLERLAAIHAQMAEERRRLEEWKKSTDKQ